MLLNKKRGVILGVANSSSIAWACAQKAHEHGAELILSYLDDRFLKWVSPLAKEVNADVFPLDVTSDKSVENFFTEVAKKWDSIDFMVHAIAYAKAEDLADCFVCTSRDGFHMALDISTYSLIKVSQYASALMKNGGSIITMSYYGAEKVVQSYNVMGVAKAALEGTVKYLAEDLGKKNIRVNAISAGPISTLSARGIVGFSKILSHVKAKSPLRRNVTSDEIGNAATFLFSDMSSGITGEIMYVDCGYNIKGL